MKFFKHFVDAHRGKSLQLLRKKHGFAAVGRWWTLVELCAEKLEKDPTEEFSEAHCRFEFETQYLATTLGFGNLHQSSTYLEALADLGLCSFERTEDVTVCLMPKLLESLDRDTKRARTPRAESAPKIKKKKEEKELQQPAEPVVVVVSSSEELIQKLGDEVMGRLMAAFPDPKFVVTQLRSCFEFYQAPKRRDRAPATAATWERALCSWMEKNWIDHVARSAPDPVAAARAQWQKSAGMLIESAHRAVTEAQFLADIDSSWHEAVTAVGGYERFRQAETAHGNGDSRQQIGAALAQFCNTAAATSGASA